MKQIGFLLTVLACLFVAHPLAAQEDAQLPFLKRMEDAYLKGDLNAVVEMTCWDGVAPAEKSETIDRYKQEVALKATKVELLGKDAADWEDWEEENVIHTYNAPVLHTLVIHLKPDSKLQLASGEVSVKDIRIPVGRVDGKLCLLVSISKPATKKK